MKPAKTKSSTKEPKGSTPLSFKLRESTSKELCFIGFDGFTDEIVVPVDKRKNPTSYTPFRSMEAFSSRLAEAAGKSCNIEIVLKQKKIGGNAPIMASALFHAGHPVIFAGTIGEKKAEPLFAPLTKGCKKVFFLGPSSHTDALEFPDGKIIIGKLENIQQLSLDTIVKRIGARQLVSLLEKSKLFACVNWTMAPMMNDFWAYLQAHVAPKLSKKKRYLFIDLADPAKRTDADLAQALKLLKALNQTWDVILGLNAAEAQAVAKVLKVQGSVYTEAPIEDLAKKLFQKSGLSQIIIHSARFACMASAQAALSTKTPYTPKPSLTTGAGDNFNGGYCSGLLHGFSSKEALILGVATAGFYVREGRSPSREELAIFLDFWHKSRYEKTKFLLKSYPS